MGWAVSSRLCWCEQKWAVFGKWAGCVMGGQWAVGYDGVGRNEQLWEMSSLSYCYCPPGIFFLVGWLEGIILRHLYQRHSFVKALLHGQKLGVEQSGMLVWAVGYVGGPCDFSVSPSPFGLDLGTLGLWDFGLGLDNILSLIKRNTKEIPAALIAMLIKYLWIPFKNGKHGTYLMVDWRSQLEHAEAALTRVKCPLRNKTFYTFSSS